MKDPRATDGWRSNGGSGAVGGTTCSSVAMNKLFVTYSTISGIPDDLEPSIFSLRKVCPAISMACLVIDTVLASSLEPPWSMLLKQASTLTWRSYTLSMHLVRLVEKASSHAFIPGNMGLLSPMDAWSLIPDVMGLG